MKWSLSRWLKLKNKLNVCPKCGGILILSSCYEPAASGDRNAEWVLGFCKKCNLSVDVWGKKISRSIIGIAKSCLGISYGASKTPYPDDPFRLPLHPGTSARMSELMLKRKIFVGSQEIRRMTYGKKIRRLNRELAPVSASGRLWTKDVFGKTNKDCNRTIGAKGENNQETKSGVDTLKSSSNMTLKRGKSYRR